MQFAILLYFNIYDSGNKANIKEVLMIFSPRITYLEST